MSAITVNREQQDETRSYSVALLRSLRFAGVKFIRYTALDVCNNTRCKAVPVDRILRTGSDLRNRVSVAKVCYVGLPSHADSIVPESGLDASESVILSPAMETFRVLPYATQSALVVCNLFDPQSGFISDACCRGLLQSVVERCRTKYNLTVNVGAELEFNLLSRKDNKPVDASHFAAMTSLNEQETYLSDVYDQLSAQDIEVELVHAESAPGQLEIVLKYQDDPVRLADHVYLARETIRAVAYKHGLKAIFLPKCHSDQAGNGCHLHLSLRDLEPTNLTCSGSPVMTIKSDHRAAYFVEGILHHLGSLLALTIPSTNSFARVGPGCWTGFESTWEYEDKEAPIRVVSASEPDGLQHFEYKLCDSVANPYLALVGILIAGLDGIDAQRQLRPGRKETTEGDRIPLPTSLCESLDLLEKNSVLNKAIPPVMMKGYLALRRAEAERSAKMSLEEQLQEALDQA